MGVGETQLSWSSSESDMRNKMPLRPVVWLLVSEQVHLMGILLKMNFLILSFSSHAALLLPQESQVRQFSNTQRSARRSYWI